MSPSSTYLDLSWSLIVRKCILKDACQQNYYWLPWTLFVSVRVIEYLLFYIWISRLPIIYANLLMPPSSIAIFHFWNRFRNITLSQNNKQTSDQSHFFRDIGYVDPCHKMYLSYILKDRLCHHLVSVKFTEHSQALILNNVTNLIMTSTECC